MKQKDRDAIAESLRGLADKVVSGEIEIQNVTSRRGVMTEPSRDGYTGIQYPTGEFWLEIHYFQQR
jgi:hypothetical protein